MPAYSFKEAPLSAGFGIHDSTKEAGIVEKRPAEAEILRGPARTLGDHTSPFLRSAARILAVGGGAGAYVT
jgi:hypothetical protein